MITASSVSTSGVSIKVYEKDGSDWIPIRYDWVYGSGSYSIRGLPPGTYRVGFSQYINSTIFETFYNNATDVLSATDVLVTVGNTTSGIDATLGDGNQPPDEPIAGLQASNSSPTTLGNATAFWASVNSGTNVVYSWDFGDGATATGASATHTYAQPGTYSATVTASNAAGSTSATATPTQLPTATATATPITPPATTITLAVAKAADSASAYRVTNTSAAVAVIRHTFYNGDHTSGSPVFTMASMLTPGQYMVILLATQPLPVGFSGEVVITPDQAVTAELAVPPAKGALSGRVTLAGGTPLANISVEVIPLIGTWSCAGLVETDADGRYAFNNLNAGSYRIYFFDSEHTYADEYYNNGADVEHATTVTVVGGQTTGGVDAILETPAPPVALVDSSSGSVATNAHTGEVTVSMPQGVRSDLTLVRIMSCASGQTPADVVMKLGTASYPMAEATAGRVSIR